MIKVSNLKYIYQKKDLALDDISFEINDGEFVSILGHNGSGKSTLSKILVGLLEPTKGEVIINGLKMNLDNINEIRKNVGIVFQNPDNQFVGVTVKDDIAFGMENRNICYEEMLKRIDKYARLVNMQDYLERNPEQLSGGQKQRVAISSVLAFEPDIIILDEATSMLDPEGVKEVNNTIKNLIGKKTIISITHNLNEAIYADRVIVLNKGQITLNGSPQEVFKEKDKLKEANLDVTIPMKLLELIENSNIKNKDMLRSILWELTFQK